MCQTYTHDTVISGRHRLKAVVKAQAVNMVKEVEQLKESDPKRAWKALKKLMGVQRSKVAKLEVVVDVKGAECRGKDARDAVRDAYAALGVEDLLDTNCDAEFARLTRLHVRRMEAERIC